MGVGVLGALLAATLGLTSPAGGQAVRLIETPATGSGGGGAFVILYSGDGGWANSDRRVARALAARGLPVAGFDSLHYFWRTRSKATEAADLAAAIRTYSNRWRRAQVILAGFSFGASELPSIAAQLPATERRQVRAIVLLAPTDYYEAALRPTSWLNIKGPHATPIAPYLAALKGVEVVCIYGQHDHQAACPRLDSSMVQTRTLPGGHLFRGQYDVIADMVASLAEGRPAGPRAPGN